MKGGRCVQPRLELFWIGSGHKQGQGNLGYYHKCGRNYSKSYAGHTLAKINRESKKVTN